MILNLAFQSIGVVYGDIGTSPLYVYASTFTDGIKSNDDILGVLSLIYYTLTFLPLIKYVFIVLRANDNGEGKIQMIVDPSNMNLKTINFDPYVHICDWMSIVFISHLLINYELSSLMILYKMVSSRVCMLQLPIQ